MQTRALVIAVIVVALLALIGAWLVLAPDTGPTLATMQQASAERAGGAGPSSASAGATDGSARTAAGDPLGANGERGTHDPTNAEGPSGPEVAAAELGPVPDLDDPQLAADFVEARVLDLLGQIAPEIPSSEVRTRCSDDGKTCIFSAPWPGDDLVPRWVRAIGDGRTGKDRLQGVTFSRFGPVERNGQKLLEIEAAAPTIY